MGLLTFLNDINIEVPSFLYENVLIFISFDNFEVTIFKNLLTCLI